MWDRYTQIVTFVAVVALGRDMNKIHKRIEIPFRITSSGHLVLDAAISNKKTRFVIDTAAAKSVIDAQEVDKLKIRKRKNSKNDKVSGLGTSNHTMERLPPFVIEIGRATITDSSFISLDLSHVKKAGGRGGLHGLLGSDFLRTYRAIINYEKSLLSLTLSADASGI